MKQLAVALLAGVVLAAAVALSQPAPKAADPAPDLRAQAESRNPWTHLKVNAGPDDFQFAVVSDRTGGHRAEVFARAVERLNLLQPEFVLSVGDLIEGTNDRQKALDQWKEFQAFTARLQMPFFYCPGNHDLPNPELDKVWQEKFGRRYYHFSYRGVLFLVLNSEDPPGTSGLSEAQVAWAAKTLADNADARWTVVALHKPVWTGDVAKNRWGEVEKALAGRNYTVFAGHVHRYQKFVRNGMNYYQLATTGGSSRLRGVKYGEFDHLVWVTMKKAGPVLANLMLDGILPEDLTLPAVTEPVTPPDRKPTHPVKGWAYVDGVAASGATVAFHVRPEGSKTTRQVGDAAVEGDGSFQASCYGAFDGLPAGEYMVTVAYDGRYAPAGDRRSSVPARYTKADTTPLTAVVKAGANEFTFEVRPEAEAPKAGKD